MTIGRYDPFDSLVRWQRDMGRLFGNGLRAVDSDFASGERRWTPAIDIREDGGSYVIRADLPGVQRDDVEITMDRDVLTIRGKREAAQSSEGGKLLRSERINGTFHRRFTLPETINRDDIVAKYDNGVLEVVLPKGTEAQPRKIALAG